MKRFTALLLPLTLALAACGGPTEQQAAAPAAPAPAKPLDQPEQPKAPTSADEMAGKKIAEVIAGAWRSPENKARDQYRHPAETLKFFGIRPNMTLVEITPGGGWYTEILAPLMKGSGTYIAAVTADSTSDYARKNNETFRAMLAADPAQYGEAKIVEYDPKAPSFGAPASADAVVTFRNVHNFVMGDHEQQMFKGFFDVLKPGGILGVVDHRAAAGADLAKIKDSGYLPQDYVIKLATDAGFKLVGSSEINANPKDTKDYPKGVWTLPPTLRLGDQDKGKYLAIGESDRMTLKFKKPAGDEIFHQGNDSSGGN